jgi:hypothetical protein
LSEVKSFILADNIENVSVPGANGQRIFLFGLGSLEVGVEKSGAGQDLSLRSSLS